MKYHEARDWAIEDGRLLRLPTWPADRYIFWSAEHSARVEDVQPSGGIPDQVLQFERMIGNESLKVQGVMIIRTTRGILKSYFPSDPEYDSDDWECVELKGTWSEFVDSLTE